MITVRTEVIGAEAVKARIDALKPQILAGVKGALDTWSEELSNYVKDNKLSGNPIKQRSGALRESVNAYRADDGDILQGGAGAGAGLDYAKALEYGSRPHEILPRNGKFLRFEKDGRVIFARRVNHPGNRPFRYMRDSFAENSADGVQRIRAAVQEAILA